jgi:hypothetical protein
MRYQFRENGKVILHHHAEFVYPPVTLNRVNEAPVKGWRAGSPDPEAMLSRQAFQGMGYFRRLDTAGAAGGAHIAGEAEPHGITGENLVPHSSSDHGNYLPWRVFHGTRHRATTGTGTTLDAGKDMLTTGCRLDLIQETRHIHINVTTKPIIGQIGMMIEKDSKSPFFKRGRLGGGKSKG